MRAKIIGTGSALPEKVLTNSDLETKVETSDEWITTRTGIKERRIAAEGEYTSTFALRAAQNALKMANISAEELDFIIVGTVTPDFPFPSTACILQNELKAKNAAVFDISAACSGFIYGLSIAETYIKSGSYKNILVVGAEVLSRIVDWSDRNSCVLFGDGAGAAVVTASDDETGILSTHLFSDGSHWDLLYQPGCGNRNPASNQNTIDNRLFFIQMSGNDVFKYAVRGMEDAATAAFKANNLTSSQIDCFIPHQANIRIIEATGKRLGIPPEKVVVTVDKFGNTSAASIPIALDYANRNGRLKKDDLLLLDAFGGGFTFGSALIRW